jgi:hypothetical protein
MNARLTAPTPMHRLDVPTAELERRIAAQKLAERLSRAEWLIQHPEWPTGRASDGEAAELRHLLYDADTDASVPAFPYPTSLEAS